jgi:uncharacterized lipoprotein YmbA
MKSYFFRLLAVIISGTLWVVLAGCTSSPSSRFYILSSLATPGPEMKPLPGERCLSLGVGPIKIPDYLDRPQIVTRVAQDEIALAEFDRWAGNLKDNLTRVLANNLSTLLCTKNISLFPWVGGIPIDYRIEVEVIRMDGSLGGNVSLEAWWIILSGDKKQVLFAKKSNFTEATGGKDYKSLVSAQSRALEKLSREIAEAIRPLAKSS